MGLIGVLLFAFNGQAKANCEGNEYQQFDFWLGQWQVTNPVNKQVSESKITKILGGCVILEEYKTPSGYQGKSLNIYDKQSKKWHQSWVDNSGLLLQLDGEFVNNSMVLKGIMIDSKGKQLLQKITWTQLKNNTVSQHWQQSIDDGDSWTTLFDGTYFSTK